MSTTATSEEIGKGFAHFRAAAKRAERWQRISRFLSALSKRRRIEPWGNGYLVGNVQLSDGEIEGISRDGWDGSPEHADELVGDYLDSFESVPA